ncbi:MAG: ABC transporter substrate-binding protein [Peptococcaceae bacterium]
MMANLKNIIFTVLFFVLLFSLAGCGSKDREPENAAGEIETYTIADSTGDWGFPAPFTHYNRGPGYVRMSLIFDTLVWKDQTGNLTGSLAKEWEYLPGEDAFVFQLRQDVPWHDGEKFTAEDVVFTFNYLKEHPYVWVDTGIVKEVEAPDEYTVKVYLAKAFAPFLANIAGTVPILPRHIYGKIDNPLEYTQPDALTGTGPFKLADYNKEHGTYLYTRNDSYYLGKPKVKELRFIKVNEQMIPQAVLDGTADTGGIPPEMVDTFQEQGFTVLVSDHSWNAKLKFNLKAEPFSRREFRQALAYGIDRDKLVKISQRGHAWPGNPGFIPPDSPWYSSEIAGYAYNPEKARQLLAEMGYAAEQGGGKPLAVELLTSARFSGDAELIRDDLEKLGLEVEIRTLDEKTVDARTQEWSFQLVLSGHGGLGGDPQFVNNMVLGKSFHSARYETNQELNDLLQRQLEIIDDGERKEILAEIQKIYARDMPALSLYYPNSYQAQNNKVDFYYTPGGLASGIPIALNKLSFIE